MAWNGTITFGYNGDGYGEFNMGMSVEVSSRDTTSFEDTMQMIKKAANDYCYEEAATGWDMPYPWNWGDVFQEVPNEFFQKYGITVQFNSSEIVPHDEIVVPQLGLDPDAEEVIEI